MAVRGIGYAPTANPIHAITHIHKVIAFGVFIAISLAHFSTIRGVKYKYSITFHVYITEHTDPTDNANIPSHARALTNELSICHLATNPMVGGIPTKLRESST
ncbi:hypothetical protein ANAPRD1_01259 [Anaplasma phagocytophilum]|nr:hypothetical protein ANAPRD1_01259 [Anaplasma phagocytophilum]